MILAIILLDQTYTKSQQISLSPGRYLFQCWGAQGSEGYVDKEISSYGGEGAFTEGIINLTKTTDFHLYIGMKAKSPDGNEISNGYKNHGYGGANGGGDGGNDIGQTYFTFAGGGGGATDIRTGTTDTSRIMVAAGGSGAAGDHDGAPGGNQTGFYWISKNKLAASKLTTQTEGGAGGIGENGKQNWETPGSGGGGGYFGGVAADISEETYSPNNYKVVAHSGSSFIHKVLFFSPVYVVGENKGNGKVHIKSLLSCSSNCRSCDKSGALCFSCTNYKLLSDGKCNDKCPDGTYNNDPPSYVPGANPNDRKCHTCPLNCTKCSGSSTCSSCKSSYYHSSSYKCVLNCSDANTKIYQYGIDTSSTAKKCEKCIINNCTDCWSDYTKCNKCEDPLYFDGKKCSVKPTESKCFSLSSEFSKSTFFSNSLDFSVSSFFSKSNAFSDSLDFSISNPFSKTTAFTDSLDFTLSFHFSRSANFLDSSYFSKSTIFSDSSYFSTSSMSSNPSDFVISPSFINQQSGSKNDEVLYSDNTESLSTDDNESSSENDGESSIFSNDESSSENDGESPISSNDESSSENDGESSISSNDESSSENDGESPIFSNDESSSENDGESLNTNTIELSKINDEESSNINEDELTKINDKESFNSNNEVSKSEDENIVNTNDSKYENNEQSTVLIENSIPDYYTINEPPVNIYDSIDTKKKSSSLWWISLVVVSLVVLLAIVIIIIITRRKKEKEVEKETDTQEMNSATDESINNNNNNNTDKNILSGDNPLFDNNQDISDPFEREFDEDA